jgi:hypothetical protein
VTEKGHPPKSVWNFSTTARDGPNCRVRARGVLVHRSMEVTVPEESEAGQLLSISAPSGRTFEVTVPDGCAAGDVFSVQLPEDDKAAPPPEPPLPEPTPPGPLQVCGLTEAQVLVLRACLLAIEDSKELDEFVNVQCDEFGTYIEDREQKLEWQTVYNEYVARIEKIIDETLLLHGASSADLLELLKAARQDGKANIFLDRFVAMGSYEEFCDFMGEWSTLTMWQREHANKDGARRQISELGSE